MPVTPGKACSICGFDNCQTTAQNSAHRFAANESTSAKETVATNEQIRAAANLLAHSQATLICGIDCLPMGAQMAAWKLADHTRSIIDQTPVPHSRAATQSLQRHGKVSATYGEIANRSDLIVFWDCNLDHQTCLLQLLTSKPIPGRQIVFIGNPESPLARRSDHVFAVDTTKDRNAMVHLICRLRSKVANRPPPNDRPNHPSLPAAQVQELFDLLTTATYGSLFFTPHEPDWQFDLETESLLQFITEFNSIGPLVSMKIRHDLNGLGAETVLTLASGFPHAISLQRGYAESIGATYSAPEVLQRSACDTLLIFGNLNQTSSPHISDSIQVALEQLTVIQLAPQPDTFADLHIPCPVIETGQPLTGNTLRGDGVMLTGTAPNTGTASESAASIIESLTDAYQLAAAK